MIDKIVILYEVIFNIKFWGDKIIKIKFERQKFDYKSERKRCNLKNSYKYGIYVLHFYKFYIIFGSLGAFFFFIMNLRIPLFNIKKKLLLFYKNIIFYNNYTK